MEIPDRLPYEVIHRLFGDDGPPVHPDHELRSVVLVVSSKKSGTFRPFVRLHPLDLIVFQGLVDQLAGALEMALPPREFVGAYRQTTEPDDNPFKGTPSNDEFKAGLSAAAGAHGGYVLETDISGYFLGVRVDHLRHELLEVSDRAAVVDDLCGVLTRWQDLGVRGLPQGVRPSSPLGNFYLASLDRLLGERSIPFYRWVDDMWALCDSYSEARQVQDLIERHLYGIGLTLNGEKTRILRADTAVTRLEPARMRFERRRDERIEEGTLAFETPYGEAEFIPDEEEVDRELTIEEHERLVAGLEGDDLPTNFQAEMGVVLRRFTGLEDDWALDSVPQILRRAPDLAATAMSYVVSVADDSPAEARRIFSDLLKREQFTREFERLIACHQALRLPPDPESDLAPALGEIAVQDENPLIRAKALVAWGRHSDPNDVSIATRFLRAMEATWRVYACVAVQDKTPEVRDALYDEWATGNLQRVSELLKADSIKWTKL